MPSEHSFLLPDTYSDRSCCKTVSEAFFIYLIFFCFHGTSERSPPGIITNIHKNSFLYSRKREILINLAPSDIKKEGSGYDLPIAIGILLAIGAIKNFNTKSVIFIGELALDGKINKVPGILPVCIEAKKNKIKN